MAADNNYSLGPVPTSARKGTSLTMVMLGLTFFSASMWTGGSLGTESFIQRLLPRRSHR